MQLIPVVATASQTFAVVLSNQNCTIDVYQKYTGLYCNLYVNSILIIGGVICENLNLIVRNTYLGFDGDLTFVDTQGSSDPEYSGLGTRFLFVYLFPEELNVI